MKFAWVGSLGIALGACSGLCAQQAWRSAGVGPQPISIVSQEPRPVVVLEPRPLPDQLSSPLVNAAPIHLGKPVQVHEAPFRENYLDAVMPPGVVAAAYTPSPVAATVAAPALLPGLHEWSGGEDGTDFGTDRLARPVSLGGIVPAFGLEDEPPPPTPPTRYPTPSRASALSERPAILPVRMIDMPPMIAGDGDVPDVDPLRHSFYVTAEYLLWATRNDRVPPLVTTSAPGDDGVIGRPTTRILFGGGDLDQSPRHGGRITAGWWLDMWCDEAVEVTGFFFPERSNNFLARGTEFPVIARPFFSANRRSEASELVSSPGIALGDISVRAPSQFWGIEPTGRWKCCCECDYRVDFLAGMRYLNLEESILIREEVLGLAGAPPALVNQRITVSDYFAARNSFIGAQVGLDGEWRWGNWFLGGRGKIGIGGTYHEVKIDGSQRLVGPDGRVQRFTGGLLALPSNIGSGRRGSFTFVPELTLTTGYQITGHCRAFVGYNLLYWSSVVRAGNQIDRVLDETLIPNFLSTTNPIAAAGRDRPALNVDRTDFWAQGLNVGIEFRY